MFTEVFKLAEIILTIPPTTGTAERRFSLSEATHEKFSLRTIPLYLLRTKILLDMEKLV